MVTAAKNSFDVNLRRASYFLDIHENVHAGIQGAPLLANRELPRGAVVFAVGAFDAYLSDVSADVMIHQSRIGLVSGDTRAIMKAVNQQLPGLALELAVVDETSERVERLRTAIVDHFSTSVSGHGPDAVAKALERMGARVSELWRQLETEGYRDAAGALAEWTDKRHRIVHRGEKVAVTRSQARRCLALLASVADAVDRVADSAMAG